MNEKKFRGAFSKLANMLAVKVYPRYLLTAPYNLGLYTAAKELITAYEEISDKDIEEMAKQPLQVMPLPKKKTTIDFELDVTRWDYDQVAEYTKKLCEEHEGKRDLHIKIVGSPYPIPVAYFEECAEGIENAIKSNLEKLSSVGVLEDSAENSEK